MSELERHGDEILAFLRHQPPGTGVTQGQIGKRLGIDTKYTCFNVCDSLYRRGLVLKFTEEKPNGNKKVLWMHKGKHTVK